MSLLRIYLSFWYFPVHKILEVIQKQNKYSRNHIIPLVNNSHIIDIHIPTYIDDSHAFCINAILWVCEFPFFGSLEYYKLIFTGITLNIKRLPILPSLKYFFTSNVYWNLLVFLRSHYSKPIISNQSIIFYSGAFTIVNMPIHFIIISYRTI